MIDISKMQYFLFAADSGGTEYDITDAVINLGWEENDGEIAARISFDVQNAEASKKKLSSLFKPGCLVRIVTKYGSTKKEVARGFITKWDPTKSQNTNKVSYIAYDELYNLEHSQDNIFFEKGKTAASIVASVLGKWGVPIAKNQAPTAALSKYAFKSKKLSELISEVLYDGYKKGGEKTFIRATKGKAEIVKWGQNDPIYHFDDKVGIQVSHTISTEDLVTRVLILSHKGKGSREKVVGKVDGETKYGIRQKVLTMDKDQTESEAKTEAKKILDDEGKVKDESTIKVPDVPYVRKGDKVDLNTAGLKGIYYVKGVRHAVATRDMTLDVTKKP